MKNLFKTVIFTFIITVSFTGFADAQQSERILNYHSDIVVNADSSFDVTETITVYASGIEIKRGIYRDFPTTYEEKDGKIYRVDFKLLDIQRDGKPDGHHIENASNGIQIYIGKRNFILPQGEYTYTIRYKTTGQLGYFEGYDEIYWNVTGNGWVFPIDKASATIHLPYGINEDHTNTIGFTGTQGSKEQSVATTRNDDGSITFKATRLLNSYEGLTVAVSFPKGYVKEIPRQTYISEPGTHYYARPKKNFILFLFVAIIFAYYLLSWAKVGMDPDKGVIIPLYYPPKDFSADTVRYLSRMGYDNKAFTAMVIELAVKGAIRIEDKRTKIIGPITLGGSYVLVSESKPKVNLTMNEAVFKNNLFTSSKIKLELDDKNHAQIQKAFASHQAQLKKAVNKIYFFSNVGYFAGGVLLTVLIFLATVFLNDYLSGAYVILALTVIIILNVIFYKLLKAPSVSGRAIMDKIEGFKMFLRATEEERLKWLDAPERTPQLYENYLPYAIALDVEDKWSKQFTAILAAAAAAGYAPGWYVGGHHFNSRTFANDMGTSFSHAIAASSQAPGSSSGFSGGGHSGGGGGGGGGGGW